MQIHFESDQPHQRRAIDAVVDAFIGHPRLTSELRFVKGAGFVGTPNELRLPEEQVLANTSAIQTKARLSTSNLGWLGEGEDRFPNLSVEMETGTGKTYVYIRTALELHRRYGWCKFIIVVPSVAVREGVLKTFESTRPHFAALFDNLPYRCVEYDSGSLAAVRQFALSQSLEFLVVTLDSFNKTKNIMFRQMDQLMGDSPIGLIRATRPILILDEPQNMESEGSIAALSAMKPLLALRYSATHRNPYCLLHRLSPYDAYREGLVKRIEVAGITMEDDANRPFMRLREVRAEKGAVIARLDLHVQLKGLDIKEKTVSVRAGDRLEDLTGRPEYREYVATALSSTSQSLRFSNGFTLETGQASGTERAAIHRAQLRYMIEAHMEKQARLRQNGIKVLSLVFLDRVDSYEGDGPVKKIFDEEFERARLKYPEWEKRSAQTVRAAYFATKRTREGVIAIESKTGKSKEDQEAFQLIMRRKEQLLSLDEPVCFIFSHSALREGWDNPNVFQICTLHQGKSDMRRRQEIGRGVRLAVNQEGRRVQDSSLNRLTVIANESYETFVSELQREVAAAFPGESAPPAPDNARARTKANRRDDRFRSEHFRNLWKAIANTTTYAIKLDSDYLAADIALEVQANPVPKPAITARLAEVQLDGDRYGSAVAGVDRSDNSYTGPAIDVVGLAQSMLASASPPLMLTRATILKIIDRVEGEAVAYNPQAFATLIARAARGKMAQHIAERIEYELDGGTHSEEIVAATIEGYADRMEPTPKNGLYDQVPVDSDLEREFVRLLERLDEVKLFFKLPRAYTIRTPAGLYNPDWAIVLEVRDSHGKPVRMAYMVRETKGADQAAMLQWDHEKMKIMCGKQHFFTVKADYKFGKPGPRLLEPQEA